MANKNLDNLAARGLLKVEAPTVDEVAGLARIIRGGSDFGVAGMA